MLLAACERSEGAAKQLGERVDAALAAALVAAQVAKVAEGPEAAELEWCLLLAAALLSERKAALAAQSELERVACAAEGAPLLAAHALLLAPKGTWESAAAAPSELLRAAEALLASAEALLAAAAATAKVLAAEAAAGHVLSASAASHVGEILPAAARHVLAAACAAHVAKVLASTAATELISAA